MGFFPPNWLAGFFRLQRENPPVLKKRYGNGSVPLWSSKMPTWHMSKGLLVQRLLLTIWSHLVFAAHVNFAFYPHANSRHGLGLMVTGIVYSRSPCLPPVCFEITKVAAKQGLAWHPSYAASTVGHATAHQTATPYASSLVVGCVLIACLLLQTAEQGTRVPRDL